MRHAETHRTIENRILASLPAEDVERIRPHLQTVMVSGRHALHEPDEAMRYVYFINRGVVSLVVVLEDGAQIEVAMVGPEGVIDGSIVLGYPAAPLRALAQSPTEVLRIDAAVVKRLAPPSSHLYEATTRYIVAARNLMAQMAACNCVHHVRKRMCRWMLMVQDRLRTDEFALSHDFIAQMLGVRRPTVSVVAGRLQKAKLIRYHRGRVTILNRKGLEVSSCECYSVIRRELDRFLR
jgi:CRP-like cAMP-binding protein